mgnify:CR=1 FL=1
MQLAQALRHSRQQLAAVSATADIDARLCLCHVLNVSNSYLYSHDNRILNDNELRSLQQLVDARLAGQPLAYLFGYWHFYDLTLSVAPSTLIPRPDTEVLVEQVLARDFATNAKVLDLGTGTGAIALALAANRPHWQLTAVDYIEDAVMLAEHNRQQLNISNCEVLQSNWYAAVAGQRFALIVANPPYIDPADPHLAALQYEPITALTAANNGLADIEHIIAKAPQHLLEGGWLYLEHGYDQADAVQQLLTQAGFTQVHSVKDYGDNWRVSAGCYQL